MNSTWEVLTAKHLDKMGYDWDYEPIAIALPDGSVYLPDFKIQPDGAYIEVKGYMTESGLRKIQLARQMGYRIIVYNQKQMERLGILLSRKSKRFKEEFGSTTSKRKQVTSIKEAF